MRAIDASETTPRALDAWSGVLRTAVPFGAGLVFALGLGISGMTQPAKVIGFLDVAGHWDPSLALVMGGAVGTYFLLLQFSRGRCANVVRHGDAGDLAPHTVDEATESPPGSARTARGGALPERRLLGGAALFGVGWGLVGLCPGPAVVATVTALPGVLLFAAAMVTGMLGWRFAPLLWQRLSNNAGGPGPLAPATDAPQECGGG